jgi:hypothetical protein
VPELLTIMLGSLLRMLLLGLFGALIQRGVWTADQVGQLAAGLAGFIAVAAWALWKRYHDRLKFLTALEMPAGTSEATIKAKIATGTGAKVMTWLVLAVALSALAVTGCVEKPPDLSPEAQTAFYANRVVKVLDVARDAAIAGHDLEKITTNDTREVVLWHKTSVQVIQVTPGGWKPIVKASLYALTCNPVLATPTRTTPDPTCVPRLPKTALDQMAPYFGLVVIVLGEVR